MAQRIRSSKAKSVHSSLRQMRGHQSDQGEVWAKIHELSTEAEVASPTGAMRDVYESKASHLADYEKTFEFIPKQQGILVMINGEVVGFDILSRASAYQKLHSKLIKSYAMDAMHQQTKPHSTPSISKVRAFLEATADCTAETYPSIGYGDDHRFEGKTMVGSALVANESVIHIAFFKKTENDTKDEMAGYRQRRQFRT